MTDRPYSSPLSPRQWTLLVCVLVLLGMAMVWLVAGQTTRQQLDQQTELLGDSLANQTALLATELVLANDLISLNVLLTELTRSPAIAQAAVFTVDDQVLAIAGPSASGTPDTGQGNSHVAPIALQDSVAGYVRIYLDRAGMRATDPVTRWMIPGAMTLMLILSATLVMALQRPPRPPAPHREKSEADPRNEVSSVAVPANAVLHLRIAAGESGQRAALEDLTPSLERVADLYQARVLHASGGQALQLQFTQAGQANELAYQALCCAVLVLATHNRANRRRPEEERITVHAALHCALHESDTTELGGLDETARIAELISEQSPPNGLLASEEVLTLSDADNHFVDEWYSQIIDLLDGELFELYLVRAPAGPTRALLQRQASLLQDEAADS
ncbi:MAG: hypothetical protein ACQETO_06835 [Pseudomonadota bacterium]